jgi:steroid 5-alpha reductase family enzyme
MGFSMANFILYSAVCVFIFMSFVYVLAWIKKDNSIVDIAWGIGFILVAVLTFVLQPGWLSRHLLVTALVAIWGTRLAAHIALRKKGKGEDFRYAKWRKNWGKWFYIRSFFQIYMLQGIFLLIIAYPVLLVNHSDKEGLELPDILGFIVWLIGFVFEAVGDFQLSQFKKKAENKGKIIRQGLWKYTRHPNYFGEVTIWWGTFLIGLSVENGWTAIVSPLMITFLLLRVSGIPMLEKKYKGNKEFEDYAKRTSAFFPWLPKKRMNPQ